MDIRLSGQQLLQLSLFPHLCAGMTADENNSAGSCRSSSDSLNSWVKGFAGIYAGGFAIAGWIPSCTVSFVGSIFSGCHTLLLS